VVTSLECVPKAWTTSTTHSILGAKSLGCRRSERGR